VTIRSLLESMGIDTQGKDIKVGDQVVDKWVPIIVCDRCKDRGYVPDWANWNTYYGEPNPKPCPECTTND